VFPPSAAAGQGDLKWAEAGVPVAITLAIMRHMSAAMLRRYSHVRQVVKIQAMQVVEAQSAFSVAVPRVSPKVDAKAAPAESP